MLRSDVPASLRNRHRYWITNGADTSTAYGVVPFLSSCST